MLDLDNLRKYQENNRIEAKKAQGGLPHSIWETYSAFANTYGGILLLGVAEEADKSLRAVPLPDPEKLVADFWNGVNNPTIVSANILTDRNVRIAESDGRRVVVIEVPRVHRQDRPPKAACGLCVVALSPVSPAAAGTYLPCWIFSCQDA